MTATQPGPRAGFSSASAARNESSAASAACSAARDLRAWHRDHAGPRVGTWNSDDTQTDDTNVALLARSIHGSQETGGVQQIVLYLRGVGTTGLKLETWIEGATGVGIDDNIRSAYQFISQNYLPGDEIYLFGFSRGAFTARSLAGLITACGILFRQSLSALPGAWKYYRSPKPHSPQAFGCDIVAAFSGKTALAPGGVCSRRSSVRGGGQTKADPPKAPLLGNPPYQAKNTGHAIRPVQSTG